MTDLTEQEVCIGSIGKQKVYLKWSDVKGICTDAVSVAYEQTKRENEQLKELLNETKTAISSALNFLACSDRISETECNEQLAFDVLRKALEDLEK